MPTPTAHGREASHPGDSAVEGCTAASRCSAPLLPQLQLLLPPLRQRPDDILPLAEHFLHLYTERNDGPLSLSPEARSALVGYDFPGNVRELENRVRRAILVRRGPTLGALDLGLPVAGAAEAIPPNVPSPAPVDRSGAATDAHERAEIGRGAVAARGVVARAAAELGMSRQALYRRMERLGIEMERRPKG